MALEELVPLGEPVGVWEPLTEAELLELAVALGGRLGVALAVTAALEEGLEVGVSVAEDVEPRETLLVLVGEGLGVLEPEGVCDGEKLAVGVALRVLLAVDVLEALRLREEVGVLEVLAVRLFVAVAELERVGDWVGVGSHSSRTTNAAVSQTYTLPAASTASPIGLESFTEVAEPDSVDQPLPPQVPSPAKMTGALAAPPRATARTTLLRQSATYTVPRCASTAMVHRA